MVGVHLLVEAGLFQLAVHFWRDAREDNLHAILVVHLDEVREVVDACAVNKWYLSHTDNLYARLLSVLQSRLQVVELIGYAKEIRAVDFIYGAALRNLEALVVEVHVGLVAGVYLVPDDRYFRRFHHTFDEECAGDDEPHFDGDGQVEDDSKEEGDEQDGDVALRVLEEALDGSPSAHVVADDDQHGCQRGHRDILGVGHQEQEDEKQHDGMDEPSYGSAPTIVDVRHGACDGSRGGYAAKDRGCEIGHALRNEFHVGVVAVGDGSVGNSGGE